MSGHVFHPGHEDLHGITVVVDDRDGRTYVGRYHEATDRGMVLHDVAVRDALIDSIDRGEWLRRQLKFGVQVTHRTVLVPTDSASAPIRLSEII